MKFSHTLSLNSNPDWSDHYIDYAGLKKLINTLNSQQNHGKNNNGSMIDDEEGVGDVDARSMFMKKIERMVISIREFFFEQRDEMDKEFIRLKLSIIAESSSTSLSSLNSRTGGEEDGTKKKKMMKKKTGETSPLLKKSLSKSILEDKRREICDLFIQYHNLQTYASLNCTGVVKILKKYDKIMQDNLKEVRLEQLQSMLPFWEGTPEVDAKIELLKDYFAKYFCNGDSIEALRQMKLMVREVVTFQRQSVWLDVIEDRRKHAAAETSSVQLESTMMMNSTARRRGGNVDKQNQFLLVSWLQQLRVRLSSTTCVLGMLSILIFILLLFVPGIFDEDPVKRNALAIFVFVSLLWAAEILPLFVTSMLVPFLAVICRVVVVDDIRLTPKAASKFVFNAMFSHVIMLLIGGFAIAAALSKHNIAQVIASAILRRCGSGFRTVLLVNLFVATFASMWISNVAAPVLCYSLITPILKAATAGQTMVAFGTSQRISADQDYNLCRALVMGIALASNVGGMASPISSPQNLFALEYTDGNIGWLAWFAVSIPLCVILNLIIWVWLIYSYELPISGAAKSSAVVAALQSGHTVESLSAKQWFVLFVSVGVVLLWCASQQLESITGEMGILGIVPFALFFGTGLLSKEDLNNFLWSVVVLAMGGLVLGEVVKTSGLLDVIAKDIAWFIIQHSLTLWQIQCIFTALILFCTTFVSHTVGAIVVLPIASAVGARMPHPHPTALVFAGAFACSAAMGLPVSGFPNMTAVNVEDTLGNRFLTTRDFFKVAVPASLFSYFVIITLAYVLINVVIHE